VVARDGIETPPTAFQGHLAMELSGLESADVFDAISGLHPLVETREQAIKRVTLRPVFTSLWKSSRRAAGVWESRRDFQGLWERW
jgi:hypothetical protein